MATVLLIVLSIIGFCFADPKGQIYPQNSLPLRLPLPDVSSVVAKYGASAAIGVGNSFYDLPADSVIYITGGSEELPEISPYYSNDYSDVEVSRELRAFSLTFGKFLYRGPVWGHKWPLLPKPRIHHVSTVYQGSLYLFGGGPDSIDRYDIEDNYWETIHAPNGPGTRYGAAAFRYYNYWILFGGVNCDGETTNDMWFFDLDARKWIPVSFNDTDIVPSSRAGATLSMNWPLSFETGYLELLMFGGMREDGTASGALYSWSGITGKWIKLPSSPIGRWGHVALNLYTDGEDPNLPYNLYAWGGFGDSPEQFVIFEDNDWYLYKVPTNVNSPSPTYGYAVAGYDKYDGQPSIDYWNNLSPKVYLFGGVSGQLDPYPSEPNVFNRIYEIIGEVWYPLIELNSLGWNRWTCYPGYHWNTDAAICVPDKFVGCTEDSLDCLTCDDYEGIFDDHLERIETNLVTRTYTGALRQCPAYWRLGDEYYYGWIWPNFVKYSIPYL